MFFKEKKNVDRSDNFQNQANSDSKVPAVEPVIFSSNSMSSVSSHTTSHVQVLSKNRVFKSDSLDEYFTKNPESVLSLGFYFTPKTTEFKNDFLSQLILNLKNTKDELRQKMKKSATKNWQIEKKMENKNKKVIPWFANIIKNLFVDTRDLVFIAVPSSKQINPTHGPTMLVEKISEDEKGFTCGNKFLVRTSTKIAAHDGGSRGISEQIETLAVKNIELIRDKVIILIDDVATSGNSMKAVKKLLLEGAPDCIICLAIGKTVNASCLANFDERPMEILNDVVKGMEIPTIEIYNSTTKSKDSLSIKNVIERNLQLFKKWQQAQLPPRETKGSEILNSFIITRAPAKIPKDSSRDDSDVDSDIDDDELIEKIFDEAPEVDANMIREAQARGLDSEIEEVFELLGKNTDDGERGDITALQQDFARNMREFGYDFLNIGDDESESNEEEISVAKLKL